MKQTLLSIKTRRTSLAIIIADLYDDRESAPPDRKRALREEIAYYEAKLESTIESVEVVSTVVKGLQKQWSKKNISNKPVTILKGESK